MFEPLVLGRGVPQRPRRVDCTGRRIAERVSDNIAQNCLGKRVLLVSHGGAMQRMLKHTTGGIKEPNVRPFCSNASLAVFRCKEGVNWQLVTWNDTAHLEELEQTDLLPL